MSYLEIVPKKPLLRPSEVYNFLYAHTIPTKDYRYFIHTSETLTFAQSWRDTKISEHLTLTPPASDPEPQFKTIELAITDKEYALLYDLSDILREKWETHFLFKIPVSLTQSRLSVTSYLPLLHLLVETLDLHLNSLHPFSKPTPRNLETRITHRLLVRIEDAIK